MQTWARRGVHAALVTGGMLAVGSGVASAADHHDTDMLPWGAADDGSPRSSGTWFSGELFPERFDDAPTGRHHLITPDQRRMPAAQEALTHEIPAITDHQWFTPDPSAPRVPAAVHPLELAGWVAEIPQEDRAGISPGDELGSPAEGFHRSMGWAGPLGDVVAEPPAADPSETTEIPVVRPAGTPLVVPDTELDRIAALPAPAGAGEPAAALLTTNTEDLTDGRLDGLLAELHTVPNALLTSALTTEPVGAVPQNSEFVPLHVPGEHQEQATDVPTLTRALVTQERPGVEAPVPGLGDLHALDGGATTLPSPDRISEALEGNRLPLPRAAETEPPAVPHVPGFSRTPEFADVHYVVLDELRAAADERELVTQNPFRTAPAPRASAPMALPVLDGLPDLTVAQGETVPTPGLDASPSRVVDETRPLPRVTV
ncbi:hypothetical protein GIY23_22345 [Allosaccharopolyspora coralli]|uniref:Secreted protein n=1 Tax=Allosaccharopolyspora coralli TaxID=2665642 RepID=A0A5Q3QK14_9PSEU|nr:hypothetical protein [Allosaccharopolyspora coralli]QGK71875.1 hypothetical protein GIY23_22345 [Allosaccharopolyspora coralli]